MRDGDACPIQLDLPGTDYSLFGTSFYEEVPIVREPAGRLFWMNANWFRSYGVDLGDLSIRLRLERWLIDVFAIRTCQPDEGIAVETARADRYGGSSGTAHGGSGRCVYRGRFNVKGAGRTPLVPKNIASHSDGRFLLLEAIRGAVYAELAHYESSKGAVRSIAILQIPPFDVPIEDRCCLVVRPNFIRPAHFERSLFFGTAGFEGSDQYKDNKRVQAVRGVLADDSMSWRELTNRLAQQIGSLDFLRMSQGRFTSSNMSIDGKVADLDSFRMFDSWFYKKNIHRDHYCIGHDLDHLQNAALRWSQLLGDGRTSRRAIDDMTSAAHYDGFRESAGWVISTSDQSTQDWHEAFVSLAYRLYRSSARIGHDDRYDWLLDPARDTRQYLEEIAQLILSTGAFAHEALIIGARINFWRKGRSSISLGRITSASKALVRLNDGGLVNTANAIDRIIAKERRLIKNLGKGFIPLSVERSHGVAAIKVFDATRRRICALDLYDGNPPAEIASPNRNEQASSRYTPSDEGISDASSYQRLLDRIVEVVG